MRLARDAETLHALARALPGVHFTHSGRVRSIAVEGAEVGLLLVDGRAVAGKVVAVDDERVQVRPWGCSQVVELEVADVVVAGTAHAKDWASVQKIGVKQRRERWR